MPSKIALVAGEASGDLHGARLSRQLYDLEPDLRIAGMGGKQMKAQGVDVWMDPTAIGAVGFVESLRSYPAYKKLFNVLVDKLIDMRPDVAVLIDFPGFNMRLGERLHREGIPCVYYIPPTAWAWGRKRADKVAGFASKVLTIFPFEVDIFKEAGADVEFVGNPLLDDIPGEWISERLSNASGKVGRIGLFPGSRNQEVARLLPVMLEASKKIRAKYSDIIFELSIASSVDRSIISKCLKKSELHLDISEGSSHQMMRRCDLGIVASGTATLEAALIGMPSIVVYKVSAITAFIAKLLLKTKYISLPNIVLNAELLPELIQDDCTADNITAAVGRLCGEPKNYSAMLTGLKSVRDSLGQPGGPARAAALVLSVANQDTGMVS